MNKLLISVDYDGTYSADPETFDMIIAEFQANGHECMIITARGDNEPVSVNPNLGLKIYYTEGEEKDPYMRDTHGIDIDIWIEDRPQSVGKVDTWKYNKEDRYWYQECEPCGGKGRVSKFKERPAQAPYFYSTNCDECSGTGEKVAS